MSSSEVPLHPVVPSAVAAPVVGTVPPDVDPTVDLVRRLGDLHRRVEHLQGVLSAGLAIGPTDLRALLLVGDLPQATPKQLAAELGLTTGSVTPVLDRLERCGYVRRLPNPHDRRSTLLSLTDLGARSRRWATEHYRGAVRTALVTPDGLDVAAAAGFLGRLVGALLAVEVRALT